MNLDVQITEKNKSYPIFINNNGLENLKTDILNKVGNKNYIVVISKKVHKLYSKILNFPPEKTLILNDGEEQKNFQNYIKILKFAFSKNLKREDFLIAVGGGVIGDIAGFASSSYMRGINFIQVPTTLLADTDSSVGGKTAINTKYGKNLIGAFYQPNAVFINVNFLKTLDEKQFKSGLGEVLKYSLIEGSCEKGNEPNLINFLTEHREKILSRDIFILMDLIKMCVELKISVVQQDEKENGLRKILNLGHTYGHAIENITNYKKYTHGQCVIAGIYFVLNLSQKLNFIDKEYKFLCVDLLKSFNFEPIRKFDIDKIIKIMQTDKKATDNHIVFVLPSGYAQVREYKFSPEELNCTQNIV